MELEILEDDTLAAKPDLEARTKWTSRTEFVLSCLGYAVGLGNVWRFPYLCYRNGGGAFFIPYFIFLLVLGFPIFVLEVSIGQFTSQGPIKCWCISPLFKGIGFSMFFVTVLVAIYYNVIIAWSLWYLFKSFSYPLPWSSCGDWSSRLCISKFTILTSQMCLTLKGVPDESEGICKVNNTFYGVINKTIAAKFGYVKRTPASDYMNMVGLEVDKSSGFEHLGLIRSDMGIALFAAWLLVFLCIFAGVRSSGKVIYFTAIFPYFVLVILFFRGVITEGAGLGIKYYITPDMNKLLDSKVWKDAAVQIFFSLTTSFGGVITYSSYNYFHGDVIRDILIVTIGNSLTSIFAGFVIFSYIGSLAHQLNLPVSDVAAAGVSLVFDVYAQAVTYLPFPPIWSILFFFMLVSLGLDTQFADMETLTTIFVDQFQVTNPWQRRAIAGCICGVGFMTGLCMCTPGGVYILTLMDDYSAGWNVMLIAFCELMCISWVFGSRRFVNCIEAMLGPEKAIFWRWSKGKYYFIIMWSFIGPVLLLVVLIFSMVSYTPSEYGTYSFPLKINVIGWCMSIFVVIGLIIPITYHFFYYLINRKNLPGWGEYFKGLFSPTAMWGPRIYNDRLMFRDTFDKTIDVEYYRNEEKNYRSSI